MWDQLASYSINSSARNLNASHERSRVDPGENQQNFENFTLDFFHAGIRNANHVPIIDYCLFLSFIQRLLLFCLPFVPFPSITKLGLRRIIIMINIYLNNISLTLVVAAVFSGYRSCQRCFDNTTKRKFNIRQICRNNYRLFNQL